MSTVTLAFICCEPEAEPDISLSPIILLHGFTSSKERWRPVQQELSNKSGRIVYAVDARNHGESEQSDVFNFDILSQDLEAFMEAQNISKAVLIGHSMGGLAVMSLALSSPEKVEKLVVEDVSPKEPEPELYYVFSALIQEQMQCFQESTSADTVGSINQKLRECLYRTVPMIPDEDQVVIQKMTFPVKKGTDGFESQTNLKALLNALNNPPIYHAPKTGKFEDPALFIYGSKSYFIVVEDENYISQFFPKATFCEFESAGHEVCPQSPKRFVEEVCKFL